MTYIDGLWQFAKLGETLDEYGDEVDGVVLRVNVDVLRDIVRPGHLVQFDRGQRRQPLV